MSSDFRFYVERPLIFAHRGARDVAPENTLAAFQAALDEGADGIELDVMRCASGEVVVIHDDCVDRTTNGSGRVDTMSLGILRELDAGAWFAANHAGQRIPLLEEVFELVGDRARLNIEIKDWRLRRQGIEEQVLRLIRHHGAQQRCIISSFNPLVLRTIKHLGPEIPRGLLYSPKMPLGLGTAWERPLLKPEAVHPHFSLVDARNVQAAHRRGERVNVWTVNEEAEIVHQRDLGVDGIITDHPALARKLVVDD